MIGSSGGKEPMRSGQPARYDDDGSMNTIRKNSSAPLHYLSSLRGKNEKPKAFLTQ